MLVVLKRQIHTFNFYEMCSSTTAKIIQYMYSTLDN